MISPRNILLSVFFLAACHSKKPAEPVKQPELPANTVTLSEVEMNNGNISVGKAEKGTATSFLKVNGIVDVPPQNLVTISFPIGGYLVSTNLLPGSKVTKGEAIAEMRDQSLIQMQQDFLVAKSRAGFLQKEFERQKMLNSTKTTSDKVLEQTQSDYQTQVILMNALAQKLKMINIDPDKLDESHIRQSVMIYSPINGYVTAVKVNIGKYVNPSDVLFELVNPTDLHLAIKVFEKDLDKVQQGQRILASLVNNPEKKYDAEIILISRNVESDRSALIHCHFLHSTEHLLPGMFANAIIETKNNDAILVPEEAVVRNGNDQYVFIEKKKGLFEQLPVKAGTAVNGKIDIQADNIDLLRQNMVIKNAYTVMMKMHNKAEEE